MTLPNFQGRILDRVIKGNRDGFGKAIELYITFSVGDTHTHTHTHTHPRAMIQHRALMRPSLGGITCSVATPAPAWLTARALARFTARRHDRDSHVVEGAPHILTRHTVLVSRQVATAFTGAVRQLCFASAGRRIAYTMRTRVFRALVTQDVECVTSPVTVAVASSTIRTRRYASG